MKVEFEKEKDGRWIAEVPSLPGVMAYGKTKQEAQRKVSAIALRPCGITGEVRCFSATGREAHEKECPSQARSTAPEYPKGAEAAAEGLGPAACA